MTKNTALFLALAALTAPIVADAAPRPRVVIDAAVNGQGPKYGGKVYFFVGDYYLSYDWAHDRVDDVRQGGLGPRPSRNWPLEGAFLTSVDGVLDGGGDHAGTSYAFKDGKYLRYDWGNEANDDRGGTASEFKLAGVFGQRIDAALNGAAFYTGYAYFFRDSMYVKYKWKVGTTPGKLVGSVNSIAAGWKLPGGFSQHIDAAVNGVGKWAGRAYFFRNDEYVRYLWGATNKPTDRPDGGAQKIQKNWPGLVELAQAARGATVARGWIKDTLTALRDDLARAQANQPSTPLVGAALPIHFGLNNVNDRKTQLPEIIARYEAVLGILDNPAAVFRFSTPAEATTDGFPSDPAYASYQGAISFAEDFANYGPMAQAAMVLHETVHFVDQPSLQAANHVSEWDTAKYAAQTIAQHVHNPSSYASCAAHIATGTDHRYGLGKPDL